MIILHMCQTKYLESMNSAVCHRKDSADERSLGEKRKRIPGE